MRTFDELCKWAQVTPEERIEAAWFLASLRMRKTVEQLLGAATAVTSQQHSAQGE